MSYDNKMAYSENPYVDVVIYYAKQLGLGTVLKMDQEALKHETLESKRNADFLFECIENTMTFDMYGKFSSDVLTKIGIIGDYFQLPYIMNPELIPDQLKEQALEYGKQEFIENYEELNDYYRMLNGLPPLGYENVYTDWEPPEDIVIDTSIPVHEMGKDAIHILKVNGVLDNMIAEDPTNRAYLKYVSDPINPYFARKANRFSVLYVPSIEKQEIYNEYRDRLGINREYALYAVYSEAYKYESDYYDNFIAVFIVLSTIIDLVSRVGEFITRREVFDIRTVRYIFESYGIDFFGEIPLKYQIKMVKNIHTLLKYKSTPKNMVDICQLFGFDNITIFKYYLLKSRNIVDRVDIGYSLTGDNSTDFDLNFVKIPINEPMDEYIRNRLYWKDYDEITGNDPSWDGDLDHDYVKSQHLATNFNYSRTKYVSIDSMYDMATISMQQAYFLNMLYDNMEYESLINLSIPYLGTDKFNVADIFIFLNSLMYQYNNMKDLITDTPTKVMSILGFNFAADLEYMHECLDKIGWGLNTFNVKIKGVEDFERFIEPQESIPNLESLVHIYKNNTEILKTIKMGMKTADNLKDYNTFKYLYDSLMIIDLTFDHFADPVNEELYVDSEGDATYTEYLRHKCPALYAKLVEISSMPDDEFRVDYVANMIDNICYILDAYLDTDEFYGLFYNLPVVSIEAVKGYIKTVIDFYKSYKVHFLGINTVYYLNDPYDGWIKIIDWIQMNRWFEKTEIVQPIEGIYKTSVDWMNRDKCLVEDSAIVIRTISRLLNPYEIYQPKFIPTFKNTMTVPDNPSVCDNYVIQSWHDVDEPIGIEDDRKRITADFTVKKDPLEYYDDKKLLAILKKDSEFLYSDIYKQIYSTFESDDRFEYGDILTYYLAKFDAKIDQYRYDHVEYPQTITSHVTVASELETNENIRMDNYMDPSFRYIPRDSIEWVNVLTVNDSMDIGELSANSSYT